MGVYDMIIHPRQLYQEQARYESYNQFVINYNMSEFNKPLPELLSILRTTEKDINKGTPFLMVQGTKKNSKGKKAKGASKCDSGALKPKAKVAKDDYFFQYGKSGHWKRNYKLMGKVAEQIPQGVVAQSSAQVTQEPRRSGRIHHEPERYEFLVIQDNDVLLVDNDELTTYTEAVKGPDSEKWLEAMRFEMKSMFDN
ncbi:hypothetical protein CRG98_014840 [Punica granatum]|uniref:Uncharacterized protein n=1 Tax=Punica granatum TaxID=22663 RepID=A0A2I0K8B0_PUNGR|nr:hypothetical protein CRG98_014840 [Punica granatum]